ncbi:glycerophosphodiester phosphodiesterase [Psychrosphaera algicola]|uniref:Glycerophosphodiester phosphodiesterase family protein n=1 Tax=Psychrosphaera algicola TaxID=3023714 RepID=A0ABT5FF22_9GAMM|nr:glycerophosphodiester phosphodiesterase family protein [Psychrosphaera sp. G1-22]MDC2889483.1 glycerophosphodiester phosphodiesterase family protein [Psychrosphaera sp. G1-22]
MKVFAHRGESAIYPENSQTAIQQCSRDGMDGIEIDLYQTVDDQFVVFHDRWMTRILGLNKRTVDLTASDLAQLNGKDDKPLPTLAWTLAALANSGLILNIELKNIHNIELFYRQLLEGCEQSQFDLNLIIISSFNHQYLADFAKLSSFIKLGLLLGTHPAGDDLLLPDFPIYSVHLDMDNISEALIRRYQQLGVHIYVFTVDQEEEIDWLYEMNVDGIFANNPRQISNSALRQVALE